MSTVLYDSENRIVSYHDLQDKRRWCKDGETLEQSFVRRFSSLSYLINPEKEINPYAPDLLNSQTQKLTDLKSQHSPFFMAGRLFSIEPTFAVVFNVKDRVRYEEFYPHIDILYYIDWVPIKADINGKIFTVSSHKGVYKTSFMELLTILKKSPIHSYKQRVNDNVGNAKESYVIDIRNPIFKRLV
jgi:hypothetical protein